MGVLKSLITNQEDLGQALNAGLATAVGAEILEGLKYVDGANPTKTSPASASFPTHHPFSGRAAGHRRYPRRGRCAGQGGQCEDVVKVVKDYQSKGIMTFMVGDVIEQCAEGGVKMGLELRVIPLGHDVTSVIHVVTVAIRAALIFGNIQPGNLAGLLDYTKNRVPAFVNTFGAIDSVVVSAGAGAIALGFPVVVDIDLGENQVPGALESVCDHAETVKKSLELRNIKIKVKELPIPVAFAAAFEGEIIRKADMHNEIWSAKNPTAELVVMRELNEIEDHKITIVGPDFDQPRIWLWRPTLRWPVRRCRWTLSPLSSGSSTHGSTTWKASCTPASAIRSVSVSATRPTTPVSRLKDFGRSSVRHDHGRV